MTLQVDHLILEALKEDISSEDVTTNSVMKEAVPGEVDLICKEDGIIAGLEIFSRVFTLLDADTKVELFCKDGDEAGSQHIHIRLRHFLKEQGSHCWIPEKRRRICVFLRNMLFV